MGYYVNPSNESKESFLMHSGTRIPSSTAWADVPKGSLPVVWVDNGFMTAAGICYDESEFKQFLDPSDERPKKIYTVEIEKLLIVSDLPAQMATLH